MELVLILALFALIIAIIAIVMLNNTFQDLLKEVKKTNTENTEQTNKKAKTRVRAKIAPTNFSNVLNGRAYDKYKNKDGLYEPVKQKGGISLQPKKREE